MGRQRQGNGETCEAEAGGRDEAKAAGKGEEGRRVEEKESNAWLERRMQEIQRELRNSRRCTTSCERL